LHESDNPDQIKKLFDDKIRTNVSANDTLFALTNPARDTPTIEYAIAVTKIQSVLSEQNVFKITRFLSNAQNAMSIWRNLLSEN